MFYVKTRLNDETCLVTEITDENVFCHCPVCGKETPVDLQELAESGDFDLFCETVYCEDCCKKELNESPLTPWGDSGLYISPVGKLWLDSNVLGQAIGRDATRDVETVRNQGFSKVFCQENFCPADDDGEHSYLLSRDGVAILARYYGGKLQKRIRREWLNPMQEMEAQLSTVEGEDEDRPV